MSASSHAVPKGALDTHTVQFYEDDAFLIDAVARFIGGGLGAGDAVIVIATKTHRSDLEERLRVRGLDAGVAREYGHYVSMDAAETLSKFMVDGWPDEARFMPLSAVSSRGRRTAIRCGARVRADGRAAVAGGEGGVPGSARTAVE